MLRRSPLKAKRDKPRRNEGRVQHARVKPKATGKTAEEASHMDRVAGLGCLVCGCPASIHHVMHAPGKVRRRDHRFIAPLCREHHQGDTGVHGLGSENAFRDYWGVDLVTWAIDAWRYRAEPEHRFWTDGVTLCRAVAMQRLREHKGRAGSARTKRALPALIHLPVKEANEL